MTIWRAFVRRGLGITPVTKTVLDQHEMDWLALRITRQFGEGEDENGCDFWPTDGKELKYEEEEFRNRLNPERRGN
jgi:hypothetical protein